ncbi:MAG TPA: GAF domain-containing sensor histidine kinase [Candidatus Saccharimonadales bacterium]|nr:GAF domain-containing sensor histidine kinase [Candidatus Saccharimonadales bacterium]
MPEKPISLLRQMYSSALKFLAPLTPKETYKTVVKEACRLIGGDDGLVMLEKNGQFEIVYSSSEEAARITVRPRGFTYTAYETSEPFVLYPEDFAPIHPQIAQQGIKSAIFIPLSYHDNAIGVLAIRSREYKKFSQEELDGLNVFGSLASLGIRKTQLYADTQAALETRDLFIALAAHELRTPLTSLTVFAQMLGKQVSKGEMPSEVFVKNIARETKRLTALVNELLQVNQMERGQMKYTFKKESLRSILKRVYESFLLTNPQHTLTMTDGLDGEKDMINADKHKIFQVFSNLLQNAVKFSSPEYPITLEVREVKNSYEVRIVDKGEGMRKKELEKIFDQFYKVPTNKKDGMGLGLFLAKSIIEHHGGEITIHSAKNMGTQVVVSFPKPL